MLNKKGGGNVFWCRQMMWVCLDDKAAASHKEGKLEVFRLSLGMPGVHTNVAMFSFIEIKFNLVLR